MWFLLLALMTTPRVNVVTDFGAVAGTDCTSAFQSAADWFTTNNTPGYLYVPGATSTYQLSNPTFIDQDGVWVVGDGEASQIQGVGCTTVLQFGIKRSPQGLGNLSSGYWVSSSGVLDSSAQSKFGLRTNNNSHISFIASPFDHGPNDGTYWAGVRQLTIDLAFVVNNATWPSNGVQIAGLMKSQKPSPFFVASDRNVYLYLSFQTSDGVVRSARCLFTPSTSLIRLSFQLDLAQGTVLAWINRTQVAVDLSLIGAGWGPGLSLIANRHSPFNMGTLASDAITVGELFGGDVDVTFFGLKLSNASLYTNGSVSSSQARLDAATLNDSQQYFTSESSTVAYLPLAAGQNSYHRVPWQSGAAGASQTGAGLFIDKNGSVPNAAARGQGVSNLKVSCGNYYGVCVSTGWALDFRAENLICQGGAHGIGTPNMGSTYPVKLSNCVLQNNQDSGYYGWFQILWADQLTIKSYGRTAMRLGGTSCLVRNLFCTDSTTCDYVAEMYDITGSGGLNRFEGFVIDFEGDFPSKAYFYAEAMSHTLGSSLCLADGVFGTVGAGSYLVILAPSLGSAANTNAALCRLERCFFPAGASGVTSVRSLNVLDSTPSAGVAPGSGLGLVLIQSPSWGLGS